MLPIHHLDGRHLFSNGKKYLYCAGTSYLGLAYDPEFGEYLREGIARYGTNYGGSRNANFQFNDIKELESRLGDWIGAEQLITVSSGTFSGSLLREIFEAERLIIFGPNPHPALLIFDGIQWTGNQQEWWTKSIHHLQNLPPQKISLILNTVDALLPDKLDLSNLENLPAKHDYLLILDDSHGLGVIGEDGKGITSEVPPDWKLRTIILGSLGKAFGLPGGFLAGSFRFINKIKLSPLFAGASPIIPAYCFAFNQIFPIIPTKVAQLRNNISAGQEILHHHKGWHHHPDLPIFTSRESGRYDSALEAGIMISHFAYPDADGEKICRLILNALHTDEDIDVLREWLIK